MFCSALNLQPVEQNGERILFEIGDDGTISSTVEITYVGDASDFAWVVPVPSTPELAVVPENTLSVLDSITAPRVFQENCWDDEDFGGGGGGCRSPFLAYAASSDDDDDYDRNTSEEPPAVEVEDLPQVGPYDSQVVSSDDPTALINWLNTEGYVITEAMEPAVAAYVAQGSKFLAMKLAPGASVSQIEPLRMTYEAAGPTIPLVLTSVSAEPEMGVLVFIAANTRWASSNWTNLTVDDRVLRVDGGSGESNYYDVLSYSIDLAGGNAFVTEYAGSTSILTQDGGLANDFPDENSWLVNNVGVPHLRLTRMYARVSGWEMTSDPAFAAADDNTTIDNQLTAVGPSCDDWNACGTMYCGEGAECALTAQGAGCVCPSGTVARQIDEPRLAGQEAETTVTCQPVEFEFFADGFDGPAISPCDGVSCGAGGTCTVVNGFAACDCADGGAAVASSGPVPICVEAGDTYGPEALIVGSGEEVALRRSAITPLHATGALMAGLLIAPVFLRRRRS
ncbi:MAG: DUF2330 domain-containing protein [Proteobacteria bacterium]|nr:DUF2330 domain-containing protein [Pseudomonadota bacterium]